MRLKRDRADCIFSVLMCVCVCVRVLAQEWREKNIRRLRQIIADKVAQRFFVLMAREIARLGTTAADERRIVIIYNDVRTSHVHVYTSI